MNVFPILSLFFYHLFNVFINGPIPLFYDPNSCAFVAGSYDTLNMQFYVQCCFDCLVKSSVERCDNF